MGHLFQSNSEYLELTLNSTERTPDCVLLPHEQAEVDKAYQEQVDAFDHIIKEKVSVTGGDDWHDGAFRATDNEAKIVAEKTAALAPFLGAVVVSYPEATEKRVSLGSRAMITQNGYSFPVDVVGFRKAYPTNVIDPESQEEVIGVSPESPLGRAILGKIVGQETTYMNGERRMKVAIDRLSQTAVRQYFMDEGSVNLNISEN